MSVHPSILYLVRSYLGRSARAATWSSNTLLANMDHPVLGWHADYPYHDIEAGSWPDTPLGVQVLWMLDDFRKDNGGTMFFPGSHLSLSPPVFEEFSEPEGSQVLTAPAGKKFSKVLYIVTLCSQCTRALTSEIFCIYV